MNDPVDDCMWRSCVGESPDWGEQGDPSDDPRKHLDHVGGFGPENITLDSAPDGRYTVLVEHWSDEGDPQSDGRVEIHVGGQRTVIDAEDLPPQWVWTVATIDMPGGVVTPFEGPFYDCTGEWFAGCTAALPAE